MLDDEVCYTKASVEFDPFASEHEGYTGNAGNTVDRWYHRAAVMLWPRARTFSIRAKASPAWAIREIAKALARGSSSVAREKVGEVLPFWSRVAASEQEPSFVEGVLRVAAAGGDADLAAALVEPLRIERLTPRMAPCCADLLARYGPAWCGAAFERWASRGDGSYEHEPRATWIASLHELCGPLREPAAAMRSSWRDSSRARNGGGSTSGSGGYAMPPGSLLGDFGTESVPSGTRSRASYIVEHGRMSWVRAFQSLR